MAPSDRLGCRPRVKPASGCSQRWKGNLRDNVVTPHDVNLIIGKTGAPRANDRGSPLAANAGIPRAESRVDVLKNQRQRGISTVQARAGLPANCVVRCGRLQRTLKDAQADGRGNCRGVNRLETETCAVTPARLAAATRGSPGARLSQPVERTANAQPAAVQHVQIRHRRTDVGMPEQLLHGSNVMTVLEQVCRK